MYLLILVSVSFFFIILHTQFIFPSLGNIFCPVVVVVVMASVSFWIGFVKLVGVEIVCDVMNILIEVGLMIFYLM